MDQGRSDGEQHGRARGQHAAPPGPGVSRRGLLQSAVAAAVVAPAWLAVAPAGAAPGAARAKGRQAAPATAAKRVGHGVGDPRGSDIAVKVGRGAEGRFGLMFKKPPAFSPPDALLTDLATSMVDPRSMSATKDPSDGDEFDNHAISGGYTFFGQFVDHDITRDPTPMPEQQTDLKALRNFDTPWLDLGSVYGEGPQRSPELYDPARPGYLLVDSHDGLLDLPRRSDGSAYLGDPRNDENIIVAQLHVGFLEFHNRLRDAGHDFETARRLTRWHYQWLVVNEFLTRICGRELVDQMLSPSSRRYFRKRYRPKNKKKPMMPVEFSAAAYRFGHSMVRPEYEMNDADTGPIFPHPDDPRDDLGGGRPVPGKYRADWTYFFDVPGRERPDGHNFARLIDTRLALPLHGLPPSVVAPPLVNLGERNLLRGKRLGLASGQAVARELGEVPLTNAELGLNDDPGWGGEAPLWFYVLKEAELRHGGTRLGAVGGQIIGGTILGFIAYDGGSYLNAKGWKPMREPFTVGDFLLEAGLV